MDKKDYYWLWKLNEYDEMLFQHSVCVAAYTKQLYEGENKESVIRGALLHDVGKLMVPKEILKKNGVLTKEEYDIVKRHPLCGEKALYASGITDPIVLAIARDHHKRLDNSGYPDGEMAYQNEVMAVAICDMFDALTSQRPYKEAYNEDDAKKLLLLDAFCKKLDTALVANLMDNLDVYSLEEKKMLKEKVREKFCQKRY